MRNTYKLLILLFLVGCTVQTPMPSVPTPLPPCDENDWSCRCARIDNQVECSQSFECTWTNFHSNEFYCMEAFCMDYNKTECPLHKRCMWLFDKNGNTEYYEGAQYFDPQRHEII